MTDEELKALEAIKAAEEKGEDPFGDDEPLGTDDVADDAADADDAPIEPAADDAETPAAEPAAESAEPVAEPNVVADEPITYQTQAPVDYKAQRAQLLAERATAMKEMMDGEMSAEDFAAIDARVADMLEDLAASRIRAETLQEANAQVQQRYQQSLIQRLIAKTKAEVDYAATPEAQGQFDTALQIIAAQPANKGKDFGDLIETAHAMVRAMRGVATPTPSTRSAPRKPAGEAPVTLRSLPAASTPNTGNTLDQIGRLKGPEYEAAFTKLSAAQRAALLDE